MKATVLTLATLVIAAAGAIAHPAYADARAPGRLDVATVAMPTMHPSSSPLQRP